MEITGLVRIEPLNIYRRKRRVEFSLEGADLFGQVARLGTL
jgi:hypothetical protein